MSTHYLGPKVCRMIAFYRFWAIILPTFGGLGHKHDAGPSLAPRRAGTVFEALLGLC